MKFKDVVQIYRASLYVCRRLFSTGKVPSGTGRIPRDTSRVPRGTDTVLRGTGKVPRGTDTVLSWYW